MTRNGSWALWILAGLALTLFGGACSASGVKKTVFTAGIKFPSYVINSEPKVQDAYLYAVEDPQALEYIPCYCGCVNNGHRNNLECYIQGTSADGSPIFTDHGAY